MKYTVYRHYDEVGTLLYVGASLMPLQRLLRHRGSSWADDIRTVTLEHFESEAEMLEAEIKAIDSEMPLHNRISCPSAGGAERWSIKLSEPSTEAGGILRSIILDSSGLSAHQLRARLGCSRDDLAGLVAGTSLPSSHTVSAAWRCAEIRIPPKAWVREAALAKAKRTASKEKAND
jgi:hypothetical protein